MCGVSLSLATAPHLIFATTRREVRSPHNLERVVELRLLVPPDRIDAMARAMLAGRV
jgi:hypothetical protein